MSTGSQSHKHSYFERNKLEQTTDYGPPLGKVREYKMLLVCGCGCTTVQTISADAVDQINREHYSA